MTRTLRFFLRNGLKSSSVRCWTCGGREGGREERRGGGQEKDKIIRSKGIKMLVPTVINYNAYTCVLVQCTRL